jgi:hypothetical protein
MINKEAAPNAGAGMDLNTGSKAGKLGDKSRKKRHAAPPERMGEAMGDNRVEAGVKQYFRNIPRCRIVTENSTYVVAQGAQSAGEWHGFLPSEPEVKRVTERWKQL